MKYLIIAVALLLPVTANATSALISTVGKVVAVGKPFVVHKDLQWVNIDAVNPKPAPGWSYDGQTFAAPPAPPTPPTDQERFDNRARSVTMRALIAALAEMRGKTPAEIRSWLRGKLN